MGLNRVIRSLLDRKIKRFQERTSICLNKQTCDELLQVTSAVERIEGEE